MVFILFLLINLVPVVYSACPSGTIQGKTNNTCYLVNTTELGWTAAENSCIQNGGHLTSILSSFENVFVHGIVQANISNANQVWIGGTNNAGNWSWTDGSAFVYTNWAPGNPLSGTIDGVELQKSNGQWVSRPTNHTKPFICKLLGN